jgi:cell division septal protein FtsQ
MSRPERRKRWQLPAWLRTRPNVRGIPAALKARRDATTLRWRKRRQATVLRWRARRDATRTRWRLRRAAFTASAWPTRLRIGSIVVAVLMTAGLAVQEGPRLAAAIVDHPYFAVSEIVVTPTKHVRPGALLESADLRAGSSLWRLEPPELEARLEAHPWIRRATVRREFPRRLVVEVAEREPVAILFLEHLYYVDSTGTAFAKVGEREPLELPFVTGVEAAILADEQPYARHSIRQALRLLRTMAGAGLPFRISEVHIERERGITVFPVEPRVALTFGWSGFGTKLGRLGRVLRDFKGRERQIREIDLTMGTAAVVRLRQPGANKGKRARA